MAWPWSKKEEEPERINPFERFDWYQPSPQQQTITDSETYNPFERFDWYQPSRPSEPEPEPKPTFWDKTKEALSNTRPEAGETPTGFQRMMGADKTTDKNLGGAALGAGKWLGDNLYAGVGDVSSSFYKTLQSIGGDKIPGVKDFLQYGVDSAQSAQAGGGTGIGSQVVRTIPRTAMGMGLAYMNPAAAAETLGANATLEATKQFVSNPAFINSALQTYGSTYGEARDEGATRGQAIRAGIMNAIPNAAIEVSGGVEQLPNKAGQSLLKTIGQTALEEGIEEIAQYPFETLAKMGSYNPNMPWASIKDQAVINPVQMGQAGLVGGLAGGLFGGVGGVMNQRGGGINPDVVQDIQPETQITPDTQIEAQAAPDFVVDPYGNASQDINYQAPLLLQPGPEGLQIDPTTEIDFYGDRYGNIMTENMGEQLQLPAPEYQYGELYETPKPTENIWDFVDPNKDTGPNIYRGVIDDISWEDVGNIKVQPLSVQYPDLAPYIQQEAGYIASDFQSATKAYRWASEVPGQGGSMNWDGTSRSVPPVIEQLLDDGYTYKQIGKALTDVNEGKSTNALAKRIELVIDQVLTSGYTTIDGTSIKPNINYINERNAVNGSMDVLNMPVFSDFENEVLETVGEENVSEYLAYNQNAYDKITSDAKKLINNAYPDLSDTEFKQVYNEIIRDIDDIKVLEEVINGAKGLQYRLEQRNKANSRQAPDTRGQGIVAETTSEATGETQTPKLINRYRLPYEQYTATDNGQIDIPGRITLDEFNNMVQQGYAPQNIERQSDRLAYLNPPIAEAEPDYTQGQGQKDMPFRVFPGDPLEGMQHPIEQTPVLTPQEAQTDVLPDTQPNTLAKQETAATAEPEALKQADTTPEAIIQEQAEIKAQLESNENYQALKKELAEVDWTSDKEVQALATKIKDRSGWYYNTNTIYRIIAEQDPEFANYVKTNYLDPMDRSKGDFARSFKNSVNALAEVTAKLGITKKSKQSKALMWYGEGKKVIGYNTETDPDTGRKMEVPILENYTLEDLKRDMPNDWENIVEADKHIRGLMDGYWAKINDMLKTIYPNVEKNLEAYQASLSKLESQKAEMDYDLYASKKAALLAKIETEPQGKRLPYRENYYHHFTEVEEGFAGLKNIFDRPGNISPELAGISEYTKPKTKWQAWMQQRGRGKYAEDAISSVLKYIYSAEYAVHINPYISEFRGLATDITEGTMRTRNANNMVQYLTDYADNLAGKTNNAFLDRFLTRNTDSSRVVSRALAWGNNRIKGNLVVGKLSSTVNQLAHIPVVIARIKSPKALAKGMAQVFAGNVAMEDSNFMTERTMMDVTDQFDARILNKPQQFAAWLLETGDWIGTKFAWNSAYNQAVDQNMSNPVKYADEMARSIVAGRGVGEVPLMQQAKTFQSIAPFTLEVANYWKVVKDMVNEKDFAALIVLELANYLFNKGMEEITNITPMPSFLQAIEDAMLEDTILKTLWKSVKHGELPDFKVKDDVTPTKVAGRMAGEYLSNIPLGQNIAALYPEHQTTVDLGVGQVDLPSRQQLFGDEDPTRFGTAPILAKGLTDPLFQIAMPWGGDQLKRTIKGVKAVSEGESTTKSGKMKFPIEQTLGNYVLGGMFGQYATKEGKRYSKSDVSALSEKQSEQVRQSADPQKEYDRILLQRQIDNLQKELKGVAKNREIPLGERDKRILELRNEIEKLRAAQR